MSDQVNNEYHSVTLLSNGSFTLFPNNSLSSFSNKLQKVIKLDPSMYHYVALQEIGVSLKLENIAIPDYTPYLYLIDWNLTIFQINLQNQLIFTREVIEQNFNNIIKDKNFMRNHLNPYGIRTNGIHFNNQYFDISSLDKEINDSLKGIITSEKVKVSINFVSDHVTLRSYLKKYMKNDFSAHSLRQIQIKCENNDNVSIVKTNSNPNVISNKDLFIDGRFCVILLHEKFAIATKIERYWMVINGKRLLQCFFPTKISVNNENYFVYFVRNGEEIRGGILTENSVSSNNNNIIEVHCNLVNPYPSNENFCKILATFNTLKQDKTFMYYYPKNLSFFKILDSEVQNIDIVLKEKSTKQLKLFYDTPTLVKLLIKSEKGMPGISNIRISSNADSISNFPNKNSFFRVKLKSNDIFQSENSQIAITSVSYPNKFKILPSYLKSNTIKLIYMYSSSHFSHQNIFTEKNVDGKIIENENVIFSNLKEVFNNFVSLDYDENANIFSISSTHNAYIIQLPIPLGNVIGMRKNDIQFNNKMIYNHTFKSDWYYNCEMTPKFLDTMNDKHNKSIYEYLNDHNYPVDGYFYLGISRNDKYIFKRPINTNFHRPNYGLIYNNIISESILNNKYYKILKSIFFEVTETSWKTISFERNDYINIQEKNPLFLEFSIRLPSGEIIEFENQDDEVILHLQVKS